MKEGISAAKRHLIRDALVYTPLFLFCLVVWGAALDAVVSKRDAGGIIVLLLLTVVVLLVGFQSVQSLRDLRSEPVTSEGPVLRKWRRAEFLLFPACYIYVNRTVFKVPQLFYDALDAGDVVAVGHYPHTATVVGVSRIRRAGDSVGG